MEERSAQEFWDDRYAGKPQVWSGRANGVLVDVAGELAPGRALDLGSGEGGDAIWLALRGWRVTAVDVSPIAVERAATAADAAGVGEGSISWLARDLATWSPQSADFDLVSACFLQSPIEFPREAILRRAAAAVAPGGRLLVVSHAAPPPWASQLHEHRDELPTPAQDLAALDLPEDDWDVLFAEIRQRDATGPDGQAAVLDDTVVLVRRRP